MERWLDSARKAKLMLPASIPHGQKLAVMDKVARSLSLSRGTLDNYLAALAVIESFRANDPELAQLLEQHSMLAVASLGRWAGFDEKGMRDFLNERPAASTRQVIQAERLARQRTSTSETPFERLQSKMPTGVMKKEHAVAPLLSPLLRLAIEKAGMLSVGWDEIEWRGRSEPYATAFGVSQVGVMALGLEISRLDEIKGIQHERVNGDFQIVGLIEAPIYSLEELYRREAKSLWAKAVAATSLYPVAVILFDSPSARSAVLGNLLSPPARLTTGSAFGRKRVENAPPAMVRAVTHTGRCVMLTTPETFAEDWQEGGRAR